MDRTKAKNISDEAMRVLSEHFGRQGIKITVGSGKFDSTSLTTHFTFNEPSIDGTFVTKEERDYKAYASMLGLDSVPFGTMFHTQGATYTVCGLKPRSDKYPVLAKCYQNGKTYKFAPHTVLHALTMEKEA
jgi:hypothetical protein